MGQRLHGSSRALASHVDRYGLRTISGRMGGASVEAFVEASRPAATRRVVRMLKEGIVGMEVSPCRPLRICRKLYTLKSYTYAGKKGRGTIAY